MRRALPILLLAAIAAWFVWKGLPFLRADRQAIWSTPTVQPTDPTALAPIKVRGGQRLCLDRLEFGPEARYAVLTVITPRPSPPLTVEAKAPGYRATARQPGGLGSNAQAVIPLRPAPRVVDDGTLCVTNEGRFAVSFYGVGEGRGSSPSTATIDGRPVPQELSLTLLESRSASIGGRLGDIASYVAAFRPVTGWEVFLLGLLAVFGLPAALAVALWRSAAADERLDDQESARR